MRSPFLFASARSSGFSLVEVIVALMIVSIGLLGMAGASTIALRTTLDAARRREAIARAQTRLAQLGAGGCGRASNGSTTDAARRLRERWSVHSAGAFAQVTDSLTWEGAGGMSTFVLSSSIQC